MNGVVPGSPAETGVVTGVDAHSNISFDSQAQVVATAAQGPPGATNETGEELGLQDPSGDSPEAAHKRAKKDEVPATPVTPAIPASPRASVGGGRTAAGDNRDGDDEASTATALVDNAGGDHDVDQLSETMSNDECSSDDGQASDYGSDYEMEDDSDSDGEVMESTKGKDLAEADAAAFEEDTDGMFARVEAPSINLLRIWVCVEPRRLFEGLAHTTAVEALGLDPNKGVLVMMTTNQHYLASGEHPKVKWARQVDMDKVDKDDMCPDGSLGEIFALQGTLCQKLQEEMARFCSGAADRAARPAVTAAAAPSPSPGRDQSDRESGGGTHLHGESRRDEDGAGAAAAVAGATERDSLATRFAIETIRESTGVSTELAAYALLISKYDEQLAQLNLVDEELGPSMEEGFEKFSKLKGLVPMANEENLLKAIVAHPTCVQRQQSFLREAGVGQQDSPAVDAGLRRIVLEELAETNLLVRVALTMTNKLRNANKRCLVCDEKIEGFLPAVPIVCPKEFCRWRSEQMGSGTDVESQVARKGETVNLLIDLFWMAMTGNRWELAFPETVQCGPELVFKRADGTNDVEKVRTVLDVMPSVADMQRCIERKRNNLAGGISTPPEQAPDRAWSAATAANAAANAAAANAAASAAATAAAEAATEKANAIAAAAAATAAAADGGAVADARGTRATSAEERVTRATAACDIAAAHAANAAAAAAAASARATAAGNPTAAAFCHAAGAAPGHGGHESRVLSLENALSERNPLAYRLLRWLLSANRAHLRPLQGSELIKEIPCDKQFMLVTGTAERESRFQQMKQEVAAATGGTGSFFAFHGSGSGNWHGILQLGLKNMSGSRWMSTGAAMGNGIYMADHLAVSCGYAGGRGRGGGGGHWPRSATRLDGNPVIVAVCEVINREEYKCKGHRAISAGYYVVPDEEAVSTRFLLINPSNSTGITASGLTINLAGKEHWAQGGAMVTDTRSTAGNADARRITTERPFCVRSASVSKPQPEKAKLAVDEPLVAMDSDELASSEYEYRSESDNDDIDHQTHDRKHPVEIEAEEFNEALDGISAAVDLVSVTLLNIRIYVQPWRLFEGLSNSTVEALGLDPMKGVMVTLESDPYYTMSSKPPQVRWARQVEPALADAMGDAPYSSSIGESFPLAWMLCERLKGELSRTWTHPYDVVDGTASATAASPANRGYLQQRRDRVGGSDSDSALRRAGSMDSEFALRREELNGLSATNLLVRLALTVIDRLRNAAEDCVVCGGPIMWDVAGATRKIACPKPLCQDRSRSLLPAEQRGKRLSELIEMQAELEGREGASSDDKIETRVANEGETVEFLIDLFRRGLEGSRPELGLPEHLLEPQLLGPWTTGNDVEDVRMLLSNLPSVEEMQTCIVTGAGQHNPKSTAEDSMTVDGWPETPGVETPVPEAAFAAGAAVADAAIGVAADDPRVGALAVPDVRPSGFAAAETDTAAGAGRESSEEAPSSALRKAFPFIYPLLEWLLSNDLGRLEPLRGVHFRGVSCDKQFMVTGTGEREAIFQAMKCEAAAATGGSGSFFAFHGSRPDNWHGILRLGLKSMSDSMYMSNGACIGKGVYLANDLSESLRYTGRRWAAAPSAMSIVAICEIIDRPAYRKNDGECFVVPDEECLAVRALLVNPILSVSSEEPVLASRLVFTRWRPQDNWRRLLAAKIPLQPTPVVAAKGLLTKNIY
eukprot:g19422.t2